MQELGIKIRELFDKGVKKTHIARQLGVDLKAVYYHVDPKYKQQGLAISTKRRKQNKLFAVEYKGGKCVKCGYQKCFDALVFHHKDPYQKDFAIAGTTLSRETLKRELDKTIMLCAICHIEFHAGQWSSEDLQKFDLKFFPAGLNTGRMILSLSKRQRKF